jgi:hypothetical protein
MSMKDQGMPLSDFRFCFPYEPCSQELKARLAALNAVTGAQTRANLARLEAIDWRVKAQMKAEAHDRIGQSMALAAQIRGAGCCSASGPKYSRTTCKTSANSRSADADCAIIIACRSASLVIGRRKGGIEK